MSMIGDLFVRLGLNANGFTSGMNQAQTQTSKFKDFLKGAMTAVVGLFALDKIRAFTAESIKLASVSEGIKKAFETLGGMTYLDDMKKATKGTVSEMKLMQNAVKASNLGLPIATLAKLFEFATSRAAQTGESVDFLVESIVLGIGRKSPLILDNLGISAIALKEKLGGVGTETASVGQVAEAVGKIAEESLTKMGNAGVTTAQKIEALNSQWENIKDNFGTLIINSESFKDGLTDIDDMLYVWGNKNIGFWKALGISVDKALWGSRGTAAIEAQKANEKAIDDYSKAEQQAQTQTTESTAAKVENYTASQQLTNQIKFLQESIKNTNAELALTPGGEKWQEQKDKVKSLEDSLKKLIPTLRQVASSTEMIGGRGVKFGSTKADDGTGTKVGDNGVFETAKIDVPGLDMDGIARSMKTTGEAIEEAKKDVINPIQEFNDELSATIRAGMQDAAMSFGEGIGALMSGDMNMGEFGLTLLATVGKFMVQFGQLIIGYALAAAGLEAAIKTPGAWPIALAAGVALVAVGSAISSLSAKGLSGGGSSSGGGGAASGYSYGGGGSSAASALSGNVVFELQGSTLRGALNNDNRKNSNFR